MKRRSAPAVLAAALLAAAAWSAAAVAAPPSPADGGKYRLKPGAKGKGCLACHPNFEEIVAQPFVHTPVKRGECSDCHDPHASRHGKLLAEEPDRVCVGCHPGVVPEEARSAHPDVLSGNCVKCHDPHASKNAGVLREAGNALCLSCHADLARAVADAKYKHHPVGRSCLGCHDPHAGQKTDALLTKASPALCVGCHPTDRPEFRKAHLEYPVAKSDCTSCHDPHGSSQPAILWANVHAPVRTRMCAQCHKPAGAPDALEVKRTGVDGCRGCHAETVSGALAMDRIHWPVVDRRACLNCHGPHATKAPKLLRAAEKQVCGACHADALARHDRSVTKHQPIEDGSCSACHAPHASNAVALLAGKDLEEVCGRCHDWARHSAHPSGPKVLDPRNKNLGIDCASCHRSHGTEHAHMAHFDTKKDLCLQCHTDMGR